MYIYFLLYLFFLLVRTPRSVTHLYSSAASKLSKSQVHTVSATHLQPLWRRSQQATQRLQCTVADVQVVYTLGLRAQQAKKQQHIVWHRAEEVGIEEAWWWWYLVQ